MPHGACYLWLPSVLWLHVISDTFIALAYYSIPFALFYFVQKRTDLAYRWVFVLFGAFILLCGTTHLISIWTIWHPDYWLDGLIKFATALVSIVTALLIWTLIPKLLRLPSPQALQTSETYLRAIFDATPDAMLISDEHGIITMVNQQAERLLGYPINELVGLSIEVLVPERYSANHQTLRAQFGAMAVARPMGAGRTVQARRKDDSTFDVDISVSPIKTDQGLFFASALRDVTLRKQADAHLRIAAIAFESNEPMVITDANNIILQVNQAFTKSTGYTKEEAVGQKINLLKSGHHGEAFYKAMWETISRTGTWQGEIWDRRKNGEIYPKWLIISVVKGDDGAVTHYVGTHIDITERKAAEEQIKQLAFYDPLTQLPNRRLLQERLKHGIDVERRDGKQLALLMLDLDRFKSVNDSMGHMAGDELLQQVAERITNRLRDVDMVARLGGDEFIVLLEDIAHPEDA
ncbi:MAG TPA: PAS domain S-box protein, partial [Methylobacter sp.]